MGQQLAIVAGSFFAGVFARMNAGKLLVKAASWVWRSVLRPALEKRAADAVSDAIARKQNKRPHERLDGAENDGAGT